MTRQALLVLFCALLLSACNRTDDRHPFDFDEGIGDSRKIKPEYSSVISDQGPQMSDWEWRVTEAQTGSVAYMPGSGGVYFTYRPRLVLKVVYPLSGTEHQVKVERAGNAHLPVAPHVKVIGQSKRLPSGGMVVTYEVTQMAKSMVYAVAMSYTPEDVGKALEARATIGETPFYYNEGIPRASADPAQALPAPGSNRE